MPRYCERSGPEFWAEPFNALSNLAFMLVALLAWLYYRRQRSLNDSLHAASSWDVLLLIGLLLGIGSGSGLWHTLGTRWSMLADVIPIALFINIFLLSALYRIAGLTPRRMIIPFAVYQLLNVLVLIRVPRDFLNGSANYLPAYMALLVITVIALKKHSPAAPAFSVAALIFPFSLTFRIIDPLVCDRFPAGTHFLWHLLNAVMLYSLLQALLRSIASTRIRPAGSR